ncbi:25-hydroxycholesterol 7-alpha-hydroxylase [Diaporthe amygdali]|uniref:25-hydroxycholesterol 7-alpha-hydroxylase n=1 Tax=Phomopsis amygdali TaxID=1214568 RepID=UPI0022FEF1DA|nr:25-hydroxycholesterol 7-alpha-hydroxylase [Diaporthe amygdali]KAJ0122672.1 25-hydroxycholesterol 7-alpha-hydroxylase [Diaporthe amygdali]
MFPSSTTNAKTATLRSMSTGYSSCRSSKPSMPRLREVVVTPTTAARMDSEVWDTVLNNEHSVDQFWIGRFLRQPSKLEHDNAQSKNPASYLVFFTKGLEGSSIPYGGGPRKYLGRHFAKRQMLLTGALMVSLLDCEILEAGVNVQEDFTLMGFDSGMSYPAGKVPMRIRRRDKIDACSSSSGFGDAL